MRKTHGNRAAALIGFCLLFTACKAREGAARASALDRVPHEERTNNFDNGQKKETFSVVKDEHGNYVKDGSYMLYHQNGQKAEEGAFKAGGRDGHWQHWADDGKLTSSTNYLADKREGAFTDYEDGRQIKSGTYKNDELDGTYTYSASEKFTVSGAMSHGKPSGPWVITETSGKVRARAKFEVGGMLGAVESLGPDGSVRPALQHTGCAGFAGYTLGTVYWAEVLFDLLGRKDSFAGDGGTNKYSGGSMLRVNGDLLDMRGVKELTLIFDEHDVLTALSAKAKKQIGDGSYNNAFKELHAQYSKMYRVTSASMPYVGDYYAEYTNNGCSISINAPHLDFDMTVVLDSAEFEKRFLAMRKQ